MMSAIAWQVVARGSRSSGREAEEPIRRLATRLHSAAIDIVECTAAVLDFAFIVRMTDLANWAADTEGIDIKGAPAPDKDNVIFVTSGSSAESIRLLLIDLRVGRLPSGTPRWAGQAGLTGLEAYRGTGSVAKLTASEPDGTVTLFQLFPITLTSLDPLRERLTPETKRPEGPRDNLDKRGGWFRDQSGK